MVQPNLEVTVSGPFLKRGVFLMAGVTERFVQRLVELGEQRLHIVLRPRDTKPGVYLTIAQAQSRGYTPSQGDYRKGVRQRAEGLRGFIDDNDALYGPWLEVGGGAFRGYAAFRKTKQWIADQVPKEARAFEQLYTRKLNGK